MSQDLMTSQSLDARQLFRAAYENRYTWDARFPGYNADVLLKTSCGASESDRLSIHTGQVQIEPDLSISVVGLSDECAKRSIQSQLWEVTIHRVRRSFDETHGQNTFTLGAVDETGAVEILIGGNAAGNRYKVRNNTVCFVHRHIRNFVVNIHTLNVLTTEEGYLAQAYDSIYFDPNTGEPKEPKTSFQDTFEKIDNYYILTRRLIHTEQDGEPMTTEFVFSNIRLLQSVAN